MLTLRLLWHKIKLGQSEPVANGLMLHLSIVRAALWPERGSAASPLCPLLAALFQQPRFAACSLPALRLASRCPLSQTGTTLGALPGVESRNVRAAGGGRALTAARA